MQVQIPRKKIDLSEMHLGLELPEIEKSVRKIAEEFIQGVLEENVELTVQPDDESGRLHVVLWLNLYEGYETAFAAVPVDDLFEEYVKAKGEADGLETT